ncbi:transcriptional regulator RcsA [Rahnella sp. AA]|uniref:transcriptional regulator RcsA n=1 Tax=Rahnella sp. AA TaxID=2057180 RepID=UPI000C335846|nr:transcriptional regulator RcsA [Rahnella sp. AA]PKE28847.1 transcriptional regulator RcsA [Rahnella sp. AA]
MQTIILDPCRYTRLGLQQLLTSEQDIRYASNFDQLLSGCNKLSPSVVFINEDCMSPHSDNKQRLNELITDYPDTLFFIFMSQTRIHFEEYIFVRKNVIITSKSIKTETLRQLLNHPLLPQAQNPYSTGTLDIRPVILSRSESAMLRMWMSGNGTMEISDKLQIKTKTVSSYKGNIKRKIKSPNKHIIYHVVRLCDQLTNGIYVN